MSFKNFYSAYWVFWKKMPTALTRPKIIYITKNPSFDAASVDPCTMLYFYKNNLVLTVTEYTCTWVFFKTMGPPEGSSKPREHPRVLFNDVRRNRVSTNKLILHSFFHLYIIFFVEFHVKFLFHLLLKIL